MRHFFLVSGALCLGSGILAAQDTPSLPSAQGTSSSNPKAAKDDGKPAIRRFSAGGLISFSGFSIMENVEKSTVAGTKTTKDTTASKGSRFGAGATAQVAVTKQFSVVGSVLLRRQKFETNSETTDSANSKTSKLNDVSSADFWEFPLTIRRYSKSRFEEGARWYAEGGVALRRVRNVRSSLQTTDIAGKVTCCDERPIPVAHRMATGFTAGGGYLLVDQFGLRFAPGIRYTRWTSPTFNQGTIKTNPNQLEAIVAITF